MGEGQGALWVERDSFCKLDHLLKTQPHSLPALLPSLSLLASGEGSLCLQQGNLEGTAQACAQPSLPS